VAVLPAFPMVAGSRNNPRNARGSWPIFFQQRPQCK
jgi:hypothetical protein